LGIAPQLPKLWISPNRKAEAERLIPTGGPVLALGPTANWAPKQWPAERFAQLAERLTAPGGLLPDARVAVFGTAAERGSVQILLEAIPSARLIDLVGAADLATSAACLCRTDLFVGNDSGLMHMAAAAGVPTLGLFGPSSEIFYGPCGLRTASVRGPRSFEDICHAPDFDHRSTDCMMLDLDIAKVLDAAQSLMSKGRTP
jgi:ADP-heptose:LPS heptosyltransferase